MGQRGHVISGWAHLSTYECAACIPDMSRLSWGHVTRRVFSFSLSKNAMAVRGASSQVGWRAYMREGYVVADGEAVGFVCLSVHYKNSGMSVAHDVKARAPLPASNAHGSVLPVVNDFLLAISCTASRDRRRLSEE